MRSGLAKALRWFVLAVAMAATARAVAADPAPAPSAPARHLTATRTEAAIRIDGVADEPAWQRAPISRNFWQRFPDAGKAPTADSEVRVLFDDTALYVAVHAIDKEPALIKGFLTRRDDDSGSDWIQIGLDSYHDRRTAFVFSINPAGTLKDEVIYNDAQEDPSWDAVWTAASHIDADGWTAEFRIPLSQLRFSASDDQTWGFQVGRIVARTGEQTMWSPSPHTVPRVVSFFGELRGLTNLRRSRRLEFLPYLTAGMDHAPIPSTNPFRGPFQSRGNAGFDIKYGLGPAFTLAATINPDFGQVDADPSQINLTANELYFAEKRPFFLEGTNIFQFALSQGDDKSGETLFYSRRIGGTPNIAPDGLYIDEPTATTIYGATKISGKTENGFSVGVLDAVTGAANARVLLADGTRADQSIEPLTNYAVAHVMKDFRAGGTIVGATVTAVNRDLSDSGLRDQLHDQAYAGGLELTHRFADDAWTLDAKLVGSWVHGDPAAMVLTQELVRHLYQRPGNTEAHFDPTLTSMAGQGLVWDIMRQPSDSNWRFGTGSDSRSPGFEANDMGFQRNADYYIQWAWLQYRNDVPGDTLLNYSFNHNSYFQIDWSGKMLAWGGNLNANATLLNHWSLNAGLNIDFNRWDNTALRGGAALRENAVWSGFFNVNSDERRDVRFSVSGNLARKPINDTFNGEVDVGATIQARPNINFFIGPSVYVRYDDSQYVDQEPDGGGTMHYIFGRIHQVTTSLTLRGSWTFTPHLSLQFYAQPFIGAGHYSNYKEADDPGADNYADRYHQFTAAEMHSGPNQTIDITRAGGGSYSFAAADFDVRQFHSNTVLRWEYRPGSTLFFIWSHQISDAFYDGRYRLGSDLWDLARTPSEDVVMVKLNYWIGL